MDTGAKFCIVLHAIVVPNLFINMFIGTTHSSDDLITTEIWPGRSTGPIYGFRLGESDEVTMVKGM